MSTVTQAAQGQRSTVRRDIRALTGLRLVAAAWVVLFHFRSLLTPYLDEMPFVRPVIDGGWIGVELFFVLSGFVIALSYLDEVGRRPTPAVVGRFLWNRIARVWPAWAVVTVAMGAWIWVVRASGRDANVLAPHPDADLLTLARQLTMTQMWGRDDLLAASYVLPGWSISAEWLAYLAFPVLAVLLRPLRRLHPVVNLALAHAALLPLVLVAYRTGPLDWTQDWVLRIACGFTAGILLALGVRDLRRTDRVESWAHRVAWAAPVAVVLLSVWARWRGAGNPAVDFHGVAIVAFPALISALALTDRGPARWLSRPGVVHGGKVSYCLYLVHFVVLDVLLTVVWQSPQTRFVVSPKLLLLAPVAMAVSFGLSVGLHRLVEQPCQRLLVRLPERATWSRAGSVPPRRVSRRVHGLALGHGARAGRPRMSDVATARLHLGPVVPPRDTTAAR
ncbi:acyltransferase family protein [Geodermatophilus amargosae]|uniref:acyltransferase family protein n=1 Tax=Geodermatophilus amargosae TaxID=1296565 RepID=UPI0034DF3D8E